MHIFCFREVNHKSGNPMLLHKVGFALSYSFFG